MWRNSHKESIDQTNNIVYSCCNWLNWERIKHQNNNNNKKYILLAETN